MCLDNTLVCECVRAHSPKNVLGTMCGRANVKNFHRERARASYAKWSTYRGYCGTTQIFARPHSQSVVSFRRQVRVASHVVVWYVGQADSERNQQKKSHHHEVNDRVWRERETVSRDRHFSCVNTSEKGYDVNAELRWPRQLLARRSDFARKCLSTVLSHPKIVNKKKTHARALRFTASIRAFDYN